MAKNYYVCWYNITSYDEEKESKGNAIVHTVDKLFLYLKEVTAA